MKNSPKLLKNLGMKHDKVQRTIDQLQQQVSVLQGGDWVGTGAQAFYAEMHADVLPSLRRLAKALQSAQTRTAQISREIERAEDEAAAVLHDTDSSTCSNRIKTNATCISDTYTVAYASPKNS